eukprot:jgi/Chlat1/1014/Chrsp109S08623
MQELHSEASEAYLAYAMSVIVGRALPDARDGLKPVHRRILYAMHELGLSSGKPFRKSARVVGEVLGKFHPHGDTAVYAALVRMAQPFAMQAPLLNGHGNFGSLDNDPPAAMRYTECKLQSLAEAMLLADLGTDTVDFGDNFDGSQKEPIVLPARLPQLLVNGSQGIAVGMATNIPPHNLGEVADALVAYVDNPDISLDELMQHIPAPDFPTGSIIMGVNGIREAYNTGRGSFALRGRARLEESGSKTAIVITELPYQVNKADLVARIASLASDKELEGISAVRDESDRDGMRIVVELKRGIEPKLFRQGNMHLQAVMNSLYKRTSLQERFNVNMVSLVASKPIIMTLRECMRVFVEFRTDVVQRRARFLLGRASDRQHALEGLVIALANIDAVVDAIKKSKDTAAAQKALATGRHIYVEVVLAMPLRRLTSLESGKIKAELKELNSEINNLNDLLLDKNRVLEVIKSEALELKRKYGIPRRSEVQKEDFDSDLKELDIVSIEDSLVVLSKRGYIKRMPADTFQQQRRGTRGKAAAKMRLDDQMSHVCAMKQTDSLLFFSDKGYVYSLLGHQIPKSSRTSSGTPVVQLMNIPLDDKITSMLAVSSSDLKASLVMVTANGFIKRTPFSQFQNIRSSGLIALQLNDDDELRWVKPAYDGDNVIIGASNGQGIQFTVDEDQLRPTGRSARGVRAMKLKDGAQITAMDIIPQDVMRLMDCSMTVSTEEEGGPWALLVTVNGFGKRLPVASLRGQNRGDEDEDVVIGSSSGILNRTRVTDVPIQSRTARGVRLMKLADGDTVQAVTVDRAALEVDDAVDEQEEVEQEASAE